MDEGGRKREMNMYESNEKERRLRFRRKRRADRSTLEQNDRSLCSQITASVFTL